MTELRIGTCSWKYPSWKGLVYSAADGINHLEEYARKYRTVEVDQWFWSLFSGSGVRFPDPGDVEIYRAAVSSDFRFTVKVPNSITLTHYYKKSKSDELKVNPYFLSPELFLDFLSILDPLKDVLGPLIFQFEYLNKQKMKSQENFIELFEKFAGQLPSSYEYAIEMRNANYLNRNHFEFLNRNKISNVFLEGYWMPRVTEIFQKWSTLILEQERLVIRLHGSGRQEMEEKTGKQWDKIISQAEELASIVTMATEMMSKGVDVYLNVNNHYEGSAPRTIDRIESLLTEEES
jgi:uncharacterized protein YecE (DUF72 family)